MMVGNDIVDMKDERNLNRSGQNRFLDKLFTPSEQRLISASDMPDHMVWVLWSIKESAYKMINGSTGIRSYNPLSYKVRTTAGLIEKKIKFLSANSINGGQMGNVELLKSSVFVSNHVFFAKTLVTRDFIYSNVSSDESAYRIIKWHIERTTECNCQRRSYLIRSLAKQQIAQSLGFEPSQITISEPGIKGQAGLPSVSISHNPECKIDLSITHDGPYIAYAYLLNS